MEKYSNIIHGCTWEGRAVLLVDLDAFFASVEQLDHPEWRGKPVIVGGDSDKRGVVSTCSYEARKFGVRSAMPAVTAARLCPNAIWTHGRFDRYREMSGKVMAILTDESPFIQQVSIDEAFLDITPSAYSREDPLDVARRIQERVSDLGITCSIGLGRSKSVAKVASDMDKPRGLTVVYPGREEEFLEHLPISRMSGIGPVAQRKLHDFGINTLGEVARAEESILHAVFGSNADMMRDRCLGRDGDPVIGSEGQKSVSNEISFAKDLAERRDIEAAIATVCAKVARRLRKKGLKCSNITLKVRYGNRDIRTQARQLAHPTDDEGVFIEYLDQMLDSLWTRGMPIRLLGMSASHLEEDSADYVQQGLFGGEDTDDNDARASQKRMGLESATDLVRDRFGEDMLLYGRELRTKRNTTGSASKNPADYL